MSFETMGELGDRATATLICEFMGKHSNIILALNGRIADSALRVHADMSRVREVLPGLIYERPPAHGKLPYDALDSLELAARLSGESNMLEAELKRGISGLGDMSARELAARIAEGGAQSALACAESAARILRALPGMADPTIYYDGDAPRFVAPFAFRTLAHFDAARCGSISEALDTFYFERDNARSMRERSSNISRVIMQNTARCEKKLALQTEALAASERAEESRIFGELLSANMHLIQKGAPNVELVNYYDRDCAPVVIALSLMLSTGLLAEAGLSFLGLGVQPPTASWGSMLTEAADRFDAPHLIWGPGIALTVTVLACSAVGDGLRSALRIGRGGKR
jgi:predicted ribosome quality control (RQC) complex YloA/Tae2 family protein